MKNPIAINPNCGHEVNMHDLWDEFHKPSALEMFFIYTDANTSGNPNI